MSAASLRLSWFISNSYSKSEIARSPLTIAVAPHSRANSTSRFVKTRTSTFSSPFAAMARSRNPWRSSAVNSVVDLRIDWPTTPTTTRSNTREVRVRMSRCPLVTGS